jgi:hypothetical protein
MSYDLALLRKGADQSWDDALLGAEDDASGNLPAGDVWAAIVAAAERVLGAVSTQTGGHSYELGHEPTGIDLSLYANGAAITVPYWYKGERAEAIVRAMYELSRIVEQRTGLTGYDLQTELSVEDSAARLELAVAIFDQAAASFARRGIRSPSNHD